MGGWSRRNGGNCDRQSGRSVVGSRLLELPSRRIGSQRNKRISLWRILLDVRQQMLEDCITQPLALVLRQDSHVGNNKVPAPVADNTTHGNRCTVAGVRGNVASKPCPGGDGTRLGFCHGRQARCRAEMAVFGH